MWCCFVAMKPRLPSRSKARQQAVDPQQHPARQRVDQVFPRHCEQPISNALFPNVRVVLSTFDKLMLGPSGDRRRHSDPASKLYAHRHGCCFVVAGFYLGFSSAVAESEMTGRGSRRSAALGGALGGFVLRQWTKLPAARSLRYQRDITDNIYFSATSNNNAGIFDYIIGAAEEQECKGSVPGLSFHPTPRRRPPTQDELDAPHRELAADRHSGSTSISRSTTPLGKLDRLGLLVRDGRASVCALSLGQVTRQTRPEPGDDFFRF